MFTIRVQINAETIAVDQGMKTNGLQLHQSGNSLHIEVHQKKITLLSSTWGNWSLTCPKGIQRYVYVYA
jgi:lipopolysaccharide export system protein LptC